MKLATVSIDSRDIVVALRGTTIVSLEQHVADLPSLLADSEALSRLEAHIAAAPSVATDRLVWRPPIPHPDKILCVGLNYVDHAIETGQQIPGEPLIFNKLRTTLIGHQEKILLPPVSQQVDFEAELVVVIGKSGRDIPLESAGDHVAGYCCGHDVSARDWQKGKPGNQWLLGKSFDSFAPLGPWLVTADEIANPHALSIELRLNGETMQRSSTQQLIFPIDYLVAYISQVCHLHVGDLLFTGTPPGVGAARQPQIFLRPGDSVEVEIEGVGLLQNDVMSR